MRKRSSCDSGSGIGADLPLRILRRDDEERHRQHVRHAVDRHLALLHRLEQRALRLRRRAVHLVGQQHLREDRPGMKNELPRGGIEDRVAQHVGRQEIAGELHAAELEAENFRQRMRQRRLAHARHVLDQEMAARQQTAERQPHGLVLAQQDRVQLRQDIVDRNAHALIGAYAIIRNCQVPRAEDERNDGIFGINGMKGGILPSASTKIPLIWIIPSFRSLPKPHPAALHFRPPLLR